jgi:hypothetical protein
MLALVVLGLFALGGRKGGGGSSTTTQPSGRKGGGGGSAPGRKVAFKAGQTYALTFDFEDGSRTMTEPELLREVLAACETMGMTPVAGSPAAGDPAHVRAKAASSRTLPVPLHFKDTQRAVYLSSATPLGPDIHGGGDVAGGGAHYWGRL